jgi:tetratricopeptide (TPR) repeat protein
MYATTLTAYALLLDARSGNMAERLALLEQVLAIRRTQNNPIRVANALINVAIHKAQIGRLTDAARDVEEAIAIKRQQGSVHDTVGFDDLGETYLRMGKLAEARPIFEEAWSYVADTEQHSWRNVYRLYLMELAYAEGRYEQAEATAAEIVKEDADASSTSHHHRVTYIIGLAGLAALARGDGKAVRHWCALAEHSAETDQNRNGAMFTQTVLGVLALTEGDSRAALSRLEAAINYFQKEYVYDLSQDYERDLALALALSGCSRAVLRLDQIERAVEYYREALGHAQRLNVDAFALMALIPAAEIALARGNFSQASRLTGLVVAHPHTIAYDRAHAADVLAQIPDKSRARHALPDLWRLVAELIAS